MILETDKITGRYYGCILVFDVWYQPLGYTISSTTRKWNWLKFRFEYTINIQRWVYEPIVETIDNKDEVNTHRFVFVYTSPAGRRYKKEFWAPADYNLAAGAREWMDNIKITA